MSDENPMANKNPIRWKIVLLMNLSMLGGCVLAAFTLPPTTRLSIFGYSCLAVVITMNVCLYFKGYRPAEKAPSADSPEARQKRQKRIAIFSIIWALLLFEIGCRYWWK
jgi:hypothetical protein